MTDRNLYELLRDTGNWPTILRETEVRNATHVLFRRDDGTDIVEEISGKWGIEDNRLGKPSEGGFGVFTKSGARVSMWDARAYYRQEDAPMVITVRLDESQRQTTLLALAHLAVERPGWDVSIREIVRALVGTETYEHIKTLRLEEQAATRRIL
jgi:hypothetical protein